MCEHHLQGWGPASACLFEQWIYAVTLEMEIVASTASPCRRKVVCAEHCLERVCLCQLLSSVMPPHQRLRLVPSCTDFSVAWGAVGRHAGITASSPSIHNYGHHHPPPPTQLNEIALVALICKTLTNPMRRGEKSCPKERFPSLLAPAAGAIQQRAGAI